MASFIIVQFFFEEIGPVSPVTCTVIDKRYEIVLLNYAIPTFQQCACMGSRIFMQDGAASSIANAVKQLLNMYFANDRIISRHFRTGWLPRSPDLNP